MLVPVFWDMADPHHGAAFADGSLGHVFAHDGNFPGDKRLETGEPVDKLRLTVSVDAGEADNLSSTNLQRDIFHCVVFMDFGGNSHVLDVEDDFAGMRRCLFDMEVDIASDHHGGELLRRNVLCVDSTDVLALPENRAAVCNFHDLVQLVRNEENGLPFPCQIFHDLHQLGDLLRREDGGRLVKDQDLIVTVEHLENLRSLLHTDGDVLDLGVGIDLQTVLLREGQDFFAGFLLLQKTHLVRLDAQDDVVENREAFHQLEMLVNHADPQIIGVIGVVDLDFNAVFLDGAFFRLIKAEQHAHERALSRSVFTEQRVDFSFLQLERDIIVGDDTGELLRDVKHLDCILLLCQIHILLFSAIVSKKRQAKRPASGKPEEIT